MINRRAWHHYLRVFRSLSWKPLLVLVIVTWLVASLALRANNVRMLELRQDVFLADEANGDVESALQRLRSHVHSHMNTDLSSDTTVYPPIQLKYTYERLLNEEKERAASVNEQIYVQAQRYCERQNPTDFSGRNRVPCIEQYVSDRGEAEKPIPEDLYKFDFASPIWTPDFAGWMIVIASLLTLLLAIRVAVEAWAKYNHI